MDDQTCIHNNEFMSDWKCINKETEYSGHCVLSQYYSSDHYPWDYHNNTHVIIVLEGIKKTLIHQSIKKQQTRGILSESENSIRATIKNTVLQYKTTCTKK